jgi:putative ABC transport system permease protein
MGIDRIYAGERIWVGGQWFSLAGVLRPAVLAPEIDSAVLIGFPAAERYLGLDGHPSQVYVRAATDQVNAVHDVLAATANPEYPGEVTVSQPSDALVAQAEAKGALNSLFLGLGAVSLLVGAIGVGNVMLIGVLERRSEIGLRRALGATKGHIRIQFLTEAILLALLGGAVGGAAATGVYAHTKRWAFVIPTLAWAGGLAAALFIGAILAGLEVDEFAAGRLPDVLLRHLGELHAQPLDHGGDGGLFGLCPMLCLLVAGPLLVFMLAPVTGVRHRPVPGKAGGRRSGLLADVGASPRRCRPTGRRPAQTAAGSTERISSSASHR